MLLAVVLEIALEKEKMSVVFRFFFKHEVPTLPSGNLLPENALCDSPFPNSSRETILFIHK